MSNIYVEAKGPKGVQAKESLLPAAVTGYTRGLAVTYGSDAYHCMLATVLGQLCAGILEEDAINTYNPCAVVEFGQCVAEIGASVTALEALMVNASGQLIPATNGNAVVAVALEPQTYVAPGSFANVFVFGLFGFLCAGTTVPVPALSHLVASGAIPVASGTYGLGSAAPLAMTLATPTNLQDGTTLEICAETAQAHTVTTAASIIDGTYSVITFATIGDSITLEAMAGLWVATAKKGNVSLAPSVTAYSASGAIGVTVGMATIGGAAAKAMTLVQPSIAQEDTLLFIEAVTAHAHTVTTAANGINGADDTVTFAAVGDAVLLRARNQKWIALALVGNAALSEV
jgi:hypothetical protein